MLSSEGCSLFGEYHWNKPDQCKMLRNSWLKDIEGMNGVILCSSWLSYSTLPKNEKYLELLNETVTMLTKTMKKKVVIIGLLPWFWKNDKNCKQKFGGCKPVTVNRGAGGYPNDVSYFVEYHYIEYIVITLYILLSLH